MSHHIRIWRLSNLRRALNQRLREEIRRAKPDLTAIEALERRKHEVRRELLFAEAGPAAAT